MNAEGKASSPLLDLEVTVSVGSHSIKYSGACGYLSVKPCELTVSGAASRVGSIMLNTKRIEWGCLPKDTIIHKREKDGHTFQKGDDLRIGVPSEATVLGTIQILCALMIASLGVILVSASYSSNFRPEASSTLMSGYSFVGSLCFSTAGVLSIISGKISTKPFALSSLASNGASSVVAGIGLFLLSHSLVALGTVLPHCNSEKKLLSLLTYLESHLWMNDDYNCHLAHVSAISGLAVMLVFTVLELLLAAYSSAFWWKQVYSYKAGGTFFLPQSQDHTNLPKAV